MKIHVVDATNELLRSFFGASSRKPADAREVSVAPAAAFLEAGFKKVACRSETRRASRFAIEGK